MRQKNLSFKKYSKGWFLKILSGELDVEQKALEGITVQRVKNWIKIGYQSWRPRFLIKIPSKLSLEYNLPSLLYAKDDVREEEFDAHSKIWDRYKKGQAYLSIPQPICFYRYPDTKRGILISEAVYGKNLNDLFYLSLIPGGGVFVTKKVNHLFFLAGQGLGEYLSSSRLKYGSLQDNLDIAYQTVASMPEFNKNYQRIVEKFLSNVPDELLAEETTLAIDYLPRNLMYSRQNLFFVDLDPIGYHHPSYISGRFIKDTMNKVRYPCIKKKYLMGLVNSFQSGIDSVTPPLYMPIENKILQILRDIFYLGELDRSRRVYWVNGANRFWQRYIEKSVREVMESLV
ncbi:MAG: hypothetical protein GY705_04965 [Bacteroidetes bacterium]|nr:hypothetical protein [Bacteroidota bacterium]